MSAIDVETDPATIKDMAHIHFQNLPKGNDGKVFSFVGVKGNSPLYRYYEEVLDLTS